MVGSLLAVLISVGSAMLALMMDSTSFVVNTRLTVSLVSSQGSSAASAVELSSIESSIVSFISKGGSKASIVGLCLLFSGSNS